METNSPGASLANSAATPPPEVSSEQTAQKADKPTFATDEERMRFIARGALFDSFMGTADPFEQAFVRGQIRGGVLKDDPQVDYIAYLQEGHSPLKTYEEWRASTVQKGFEEFADIPREANLVADYISQARINGLTDKEIYRGLAKLGHEMKLAQTEGKATEYDPDNVDKVARSIYDKKANQFLV